MAYVEELMDYLDVVAQEDDLVVVLAAVLPLEVPFLVLKVELEAYMHP